MAGTKFSDYLGLKHYKKAKKIKHFIHLRLANRPQNLSSTYHTVNSGHRGTAYFTRLQSGRISNEKFCLNNM